MRNDKIVFYLYNPIDNIFLSLYFTATKISFQRSKFNDLQIDRL